MEFTISAVFNATPTQIYDAWLDSLQHSEMTGGKATASTKVGEPFTAWDEYIQGKNLALEPGKRILQTWRTTDFLEQEEDSEIEIQLEQDQEKTKLTLTHTKLSPSGDIYKQGWVDHYFKPMQDYFNSKNEK